MKRLIMILSIYHMVSHATILVENKSQYPALIEKITINVDNGLTQKPSMHTVNKKLLPQEHATLHSLVGQRAMPVTNVVIRHNNNQYDISIGKNSPDTITIKDSEVSSDKALKIEKTFPYTSSKNVSRGPRWI